MKQTVCRLACLGFLFLAMPAFAGGGKYRIVNVPEPYTQECAGCHIAFQPGLLPARAWQNIMSDLEQHYGTDASLDPETVRRIDTWLRDNAARGRYANAAPPEDRITETGWFYRKHRAIDASAWRLESVKSAANCQACHAQAERGSFDDDELIVPEGLSAAQMHAFEGHHKHRRSSRRAGWRSGGKHHANW